MELDYDFPYHSGDVPPYSMHNFMLQVVVHMINLTIDDINRINTILESLTKENYYEDMYRYALRSTLDLSNHEAVEYTFSDLKRSLTPAHIRKTIYYQWPARERGALERFTLEYNMGIPDLVDHIKEDEITFGSDIFPRDATYQELVGFVRLALNWNVFPDAQLLYQSFQRRRYNHLVGVIGRILDDLGEDYIKVVEDL